MATDKDLKNAQKLNDLEKERLRLKREQSSLDSDILGISDSLVDSIKEVQGIQFKRGTFDQNILKVNKEINRAINNQKEGLSDISTVTKQITKNHELSNKALNTFEGIAASLNINERKRVDIANDRIQKIKDEQDLQQALLNKGKDFTKLDAKNIAASKERQASAENSLDIATRQLGDLGKQAVFTKQNANALDLQNTKRYKEFETLQKIESSLGISGKLTKALGAIPGIGDDAAKAFKTVEDKIKKIAETDPKKIPGRLETAGMLASELGKNLLTSLTDPVVVLTALGNILLSNNKKITEFERGLTLSAEEAQDLANEFSVISIYADNINLSSAKLSKTFSALNSELGIATTNFSDGILLTSTKLIEVIGLGATETANLAAAAEIAGGNFEEQYLNALETTRTLQEQTGIQFNNKLILEEVGKTTGLIRANLGGNIASIAEAVTQAKLFGSSLEDVAAAGSQLLDFESSITKELEAELLTGKSLNLERARAAALAGDQVTLAEELAEQAGTLSDFQNMNVIQQEALAGAMGMTGDQMADILFQQEIQGKTAQQLRALGKEELANRLEQQTAQESLNALMDTFKSTFADFAKFLDPVLQIFSSIVSTMAQMKELILGLTAAQLIYLGYQRIGAALQAKNMILSKKNFWTELAGMAVTGAKSVAKVPFVGPVLAVAALAGLFAAGKALLSGDDVLSPGQNSTGYGNRTLMGPEGAIALNNKDTVIAGTNLFKQEDDMVSAGAGDINLKPDNKEGKETNALLKMLVTQNTKKPQISPVGLYSVQ